LKKGLELLYKKQEERKKGDYIHSAQGLFHLWRKGSYEKEGVERVEPQASVRLKGS